MSLIFELRDSIEIAAPMERCFLLSTSIEIVQQTIGMRAVDAEIVAGSASHRARTSGLVQEGDYVRWEGWKFSLPQAHVSLISAFEPYRFFEDRMVAGRFREFAHGHEFEDIPGGTRLSDTVQFSMPFGPLGWLVGRLILVPHIRHLMQRRFALLKQIAESGEWHTYLPQQ